MDRPGELEGGVSAPEPVTAPEPETLPSDVDRQSLSWLARLFAPVVVVIGLLVKFGGFSIKFFGVFLAVGGYALIWGWAFGVGFVLLIAVHELGHYLEARRQGLDPALPVFVPFLGAYVALRNAPFDPWRNALVSLAGPVLGGLGAAAVLVVGELRDDRFLLALAYTGFFLNLINLIPAGPLDGGHLLRAWRVLHRGAGRANAEDARQRGRLVALLAFGTAAALAVGMFAAHIPQDRL